MPYQFIPITLIIIITYAISYVLYKENVITEAVHAKIWGITILVIALILAFIGLLLTFSTEYGINVPIPFNMTFWHVEIGIILFIVALFHIYIHWERFKAITLRIQ